jgi:hypothetical protein
LLLASSRHPEPTEGPPTTLPEAIDAVLARIDDPARLPATAQASRACDQLRKALITVIDVLKTDAVLATGKAVVSFEVSTVVC